MNATYIQNDLKIRLQNGACPDCGGELVDDNCSSCNPTTPADDDENDKEKDEKEEGETDKESDELN